MLKGIRRIHTRRSMKRKQLGTKPIGSENRVEILKAGKALREGKGENKFGRGQQEHKSNE